MAQQVGKLSQQQHGQAGCLLCCAAHYGTKSSSCGGKCGTTIICCGATLFCGWPCCLQPYASQHQQGQRVRRSSVEFDPATAAAALYQEALAAGINAANPLGTFLKQQHAASMGSVGLLPPSAGLPGTMGLSGLQNGFDSVTALEAEEDPGPLPVLPRAGRAPGASAAYGFSGAPGPGLGRQPKPRRHR
jgi:hypothetical protein